jgi:hypothetical protein
VSGSERERSSCSLDDKKTEALKNKRYDSFNSFLVGEILIGELFAHQFFFLGQFDPKAYEHEDKSDRSGDVSLLHHSCDDHGKQAGVDRMADQPVRTAQNQFVIFFQRNRATPVGSENRPGPETEADSADAQNRGGNKNGTGVGNDAGVERVRQMVAAEEKIAPNQDRDGVAQTLGAAFTIDRSLGEYRSQQPDNEENNPTSADNIFHQRIHAVSPYHQTPSRTRIAGILILYVANAYRGSHEIFIHVVHSCVLRGKRF